MVDLGEIKEILKENIKRCDEIHTENMKFMEENFNYIEESMAIYRNITYEI